MPAIEAVQAALGRSGMDRALKEVAEAFATGRRTDLGALDVPAAGWVADLGADEEAADYLRAFLASMGGSALDRCSVLPLLWDMVELDYTPAAVFLDLGELFTDGTKSLLDAMAEGLDVRFGAVVTRVVHGEGGVSVTLADGSTLTADAAVVALPLNLWADVAFDPPLAEPKRCAADRRHPGEVSKVLAIVRDAPATYLGASWGTPINAGFVTRPAGDDRLFMGFSVEPRVDLADADAVTRTCPRRRSSRRPATTGSPTRTRRARGSRSRRRGSATGPSRRCGSPKAGSRSRVPTSRVRAPAGSRARSRVASLLPPKPPRAPDRPARP